MLIRKKTIHESHNSYGSHYGVKLIISLAKKTKKIDYLFRVSLMGTYWVFNGYLLGSPNVEKINKVGS